MSKPTTPLDSELAKIFGNNTRIFRAMRELFKQSGDLSPVAIEEALIAAGNAGTAANQALDTIERLTQAIELLALMPRDVDIKDDDLTPVPQQETIKDDDLIPRQEFVIPDTLADLAPRLESLLTSVIIQQLQNIEDEAIANAQWTILAAMDQPVTTTSDVTFADTTMNGIVTHGQGAELTIASGAITITHSFHRVDTEGDAPADDLFTINGGSAGIRLTLMSSNGARDVTIKDGGGGNLRILGDFILNGVRATMELMFDGSVWVEISRTTDG